MTKSFTRRQFAALAGLSSMAVPQWADKARAAGSAAPVSLLPPLKWATTTRNAVEAVIRAHGRTGPDRAVRPYAVFDWDNTCIFGDCAETLLRFMIDNLCFMVTPAQFATFLRRGLGHGLLAATCRTITGQQVDRHALMADLTGDYTTLVRAYGLQPLRDGGFMARTATDPVLSCFRAKLYFAYDAMMASAGVGHAYRWIIWMLNGHTPDSLRRLVQASNAWHLGQAITSVTWQTPPQRPGRAGCINHTFMQCLRLTPEIATLHACLRAQGIDVYVCSASFVDIVRVFATDPQYGYGLPAENVLGVRMRPDNDAPYPGAQDVPHWPLTYRQGKVTAIRQALAGRKGYGPLMVFGDSDGDVEMLHDFADTALAVIINRCLPGPIGALSRRAVHEQAGPVPRFVLQGRNENTGEWYPDSATIRYGSTTPRLLA
ncbi:phosphoserine phosphatase [Komagataeibacter rhaeticus]|mgnify:CR=1 FL=1|uniref:phosphoserine phosphatase n=1 Tax=Komagataeibacter rhaeticus TaxID=215221 RepID=A0A181CCW6_9PROT|nr:haloacid dehalogenase-like hydrolase [Komagataeibacter rhaeticus]KDU96105.1 phosphoserine phosphatase [Komagataeibacter rhaeticus AF1]MBL7240048.1 haloacid dehalogenase-like hydrolase [Komagataeibacter rhaeticus]PYD54782.1 phosphoserine phosphatase [Komagataeibacter rhaeticus]QIP36093.1 phosphoserine phosphatase [Komagataeibacter rhaeticus]QOC45854.1 haloacid dehalogenase-like hydrolase [Komagataeibacter rhaeticus]